MIKSTSKSRPKVRSAVRSELVNGYVTFHTIPVDDKTYLILLLVCLSWFKSYQQKRDFPHGLIMEEVNMA